MLCDLCIAEVFFIGNQVAKSKPSVSIFQSMFCLRANILRSNQRGFVSQPQTIEPGHLEVKVVEKEVQAEIPEIVERGQVHSEIAAIPESPLPAIQQISASQTPNKVTTSEVITIATEEVIVGSPKVPEEAVTVITAPTDISEKVENIVPSPISLPPNFEAPTPVLPVAPIETQISEPLASNPVPERVEYISKKARHVSFATPLTPPVSPPRESFAIPAGLRLPPVPVPSSILTPPLSPQIPPIDYFVGIEEELLEKDKEQDEIKAFKIDDDWEHCVHEPVKVEADNSSDHSMDAEEPHQKVKTEEEKQLRDQIREAFEDDMPIVTHIGDIAEKKSDGEVKTEESMEDSMVVVTLPEAASERSTAPEEFKPAPLGSPQLPLRTEEDEPTTISLSQEKPTLIILTPETEESRVIFDANNSRLPSFDARAPVTPSTATPEGAGEKTVEEKVAEIIATPMIAEKAVPTIPSLTKSSGIVFTDPFSPNSLENSLEKKAEEETERTDTTVQQIHDIIIPSPTTQFPEEQPEAIKGPYIEPGDSEDETSSAPTVPASDTKTSDELIDGITEILHKDNTEVKGIVAEKAIPESPQNVIPEAAEKIISEATQNVIPEPAEEVISEATQNVFPEAVEETIYEAAQDVIPEAAEETIFKATQNVIPEAAEETISMVTQNVIPEAAEEAISKATHIISEAAPSDVPEVATFDAAPAPPPKAIEVVEPVKVEEGEVDTPQAQSNTLPTLLVTTPMIPEDEELVIPERKTEEVARPRSSGSRFQSRPSTAKSSGSDAGRSSSSIDNGTSTSLQRSASTGSVVCTANSSGDPTLFSSETNANAPTTPAAIQSVDLQEVLPEGKEVKRLAKIDEELEDWVDIAAEVERDMKTYTVLIEEKDSHFTSEDQYTGEKREQHANEKKAQEKTKTSEKAAEKYPDIKAIAPIESTPKRPFPTPLQIQTPPKVYSPVPEIDYFRTIPRVPSLTQKSGSRRVHFDIDDMVAPESPMFILPIPPSGDRPRSRDSAFSSLSNLERSLDSINFPVMPKFPPLTIAPRMEPTVVIRDTMSVRSGTSEIGVETGVRPSGEAMKYYNSGLSDWGSTMDLERGTFHGAKPSHDFAKDRDIAGWVDITREEAAELQQNQDQGPLLPLHHSATELEGRGPPRRRWTLLRALSIPFSAFRSSTDSPRSPATPNSATYPRTPESSAFATSPRETTGFLPQSSLQSPLTPASPNYPNFSSLMSPASPLSPIDPIEPIIPNPQNQPLPIRFFKKLSPKGLISGASGAAKKAWGLVKYFTSPTPTHVPISAASGVAESKQSTSWLRELDEIESGGMKVETAGKGIKEGVLIDFEDKERRSRAREAGKRAAMEGVEELSEVVVIPIPTA